MLSGGNGRVPVCLRSLLAVTRLRGARRKEGDEFLRQEPHAGFVVGTGLSRMSRVSPRASAWISARAEKKYCGDSRKRELCNHAFVACSDKRLRQAVPYDDFACEAECRTVMCRRYGGRLKVTRRLGPPSG